MNYLLYIEHSAENLQFFLWERDYVQRFMAANKAETSLSPVWTTNQQEAAIQASRTEAAARHANKRLGQPGEMFKGTVFANEARPAPFNAHDPFSTPPGTPSNAESSISKQPTSPWDSQLRMTPSHTDSQSGTIAPSFKSSLGPTAAATATEAFSAAGLQKPCTYNS